MGEAEVIIRTSLVFHPQFSDYYSLIVKGPHRRKGGKLFSRGTCPPILAIRNRHIPIISSKSATFPAVKTVNTAKRGLLKYYASLASKLAGGGRLQDFLMIAESVLASDAVSAGQSQFLARLNTRLISRGISSILRRGELNEVMEFLRSVDNLGIRPSALFDNLAAEDLAVQCRELMHCGRVEDFVQVMELLAG